MRSHATDETLATISISELGAVTGGGDKVKVPFEVPGVPFVMWHGDPGIMGRDEKRSFCAYGRPYHRECRGIWDEP